MKALILKLRGALAPRSLWNEAASNTEQRRWDERCQCFKRGEEVKALQEPEVIMIAGREERRGRGKKKK